MEENVKLSKARFAALDAVKQAREKNEYIRDVIDSVIDSHVLSQQDRAFAIKLALGATQTRCTLNNTIYRCVDSPGDIQENVMDALRISTYEIIYLEKEPHAAVDQGVELVKTVEKRAKGLANLVLRRVVKLSKDFPYGDPQENFDAYCRVYSVPVWMGQKLVDDLGELYGKNMIASCNGQPPCYIFVNLIKSSIEEINNLFNEIDGKPYIIKGLNGIATPGCIRIDNPAKIRDAASMEAMQEGKFIICDAASQAIAASALLAPENPTNILEFCSGIGNKTIMLQALAKHKYGHQLDLFTLEYDEEKLNILKERCTRNNIQYTAAVQADATSPHSILNAIANNRTPRFDVVFVDAPCTGLGTLRRHPEIKWRLDQNDIQRLAKQGLEILKNASEYVNPGGHLTYSTCTITAEENQDLAIRFLESEEGKDFKLLQFEYEGELNPVYSTLTLAGQSDAHFSTTFQKLSGV